MNRFTNDPSIAAELPVLQQIARIVCRGDDAESRIQDILRHLAQSLGLVRGRVLLPEPGGEWIYTRYAHGLTAAELERGLYRMGQGVCGRVFQSGEPAVVAELHEEPGDLARAVGDDPLPSEPGALLAVAIVEDQRPLGVLVTQRLRNAQRPAGNDLALMEVAAALIGQVLGGEAHPRRSAPPPAARHAAPPVPAHPGGHTPAPKAEPFGCCRVMSGLAERWHAAGRVHMATDMYLRVVQHHPESEYALRAQSRLVQIGQNYESHNQHRLALDVMMRLQKATSREVGEPGGAARRNSDARFDQDDRDSFSSKDGGGMRLPIR